MRAGVESGSKNEEEVYREENPRLPTLLVMMALLRQLSNINVIAWGGDVSMNRTPRRLAGQPEVGT
jgi:hypothetical protein